MTAIDTNILVYAHRADSEWHDRATACLRALAEGRADWAIPWPCLHEFVATVTHPRIFNPPSTVDQAIDQVEAWMESPSLTLLGEPHDHWPTPPSAIARRTRAGTRHSRCPRGRDLHRARRARTPHGRPRL